jgi:6-pyruvoyltetrahydropterin/6-carboxytetrahydropterin synthase
VLGSRTIQSDGYVVDFGNIKKVTKDICKELNEHFICPTLSDVLDITVNDGSVNIVSEDNSRFVFPLNDCAMLPIVHATTEELAIYLWGRILSALNAQYLLQRGIHTMEVIVGEAIGQEALFRKEIPKDGLPDGKLDVRQFIIDAGILPIPCQSVDD